jgi:hypothetical protein
MLHPTEADLIMRNRAALAKRLQAKGMLIYDDQAEKLMTYLVEGVVARESNTGGLLNAYNGEAAKEAAIFMKEIAAAAGGSFTDHRGYNIKYFTVTTTGGIKLTGDIADQTLYANGYNTAELQEFAYRVQHKNVMGTNPTMDVINNYVARADDQRKVMYIGLALMTGGVATELTPVLLAAVNTCRLNFTLCQHQAAMVATEMVAQETLFLGTGGTLAVGTTASKLATTLAKTPTATSIKTVAQIEDALSLGVAQATTQSAFVNARKVCEYACAIGGLNSAELTLAGKIAAGLDGSGAMTEQLITSVAQRTGMTVLAGGKYGSNNGFDLVLKSPNGAVTIIMDGKHFTPSGAVQMSTNGAGGTNQLSSEWVDAVIRNIKNTNLNSPAVAAIEAAQKNGTLRTAVAAVNKDTKQLLVVPVSVPNKP